MVANTLPRAKVGMAAMRASLAPSSAKVSLRKLPDYSAATASPICSQVGATSETVARRMSRL